MTKTPLHPADPRRFLLVLFSCAALAILGLGTIAASQLKHLPKRAAPVEITCAALPPAKLEPIAIVAAPPAIVATPFRVKRERRHEVVRTPSAPPLKIDCKGDPMCGVDID